MLPRLFLHKLVSELISYYCFTGQFRKGLDLNFSLTHMSLFLVEHYLFPLMQFLGDNHEVQDRLKVGALGFC